MRKSSSLVAIIVYAFSDHLLVMSVRKFVSSAIMGWRPSEMNTHIKFGPKRRGEVDNVLNQEY